MKSILLWFITGTPVKGADPPPLVWLFLIWFAAGVFYPPILLYPFIYFLEE